MDKRNTCADPVTLHFAYKRKKCKLIGRTLFRIYVLYMKTVGGGRQVPIGCVRLNAQGAQTKKNYTEKVYDFLLFVFGYDDEERRCISFIYSLFGLTPNTQTKQHFIAGFAYLFLL